MKRFKALISGLLGHIKGRGIALDTWQRSAPVPPDTGTTKPGPARFRLVLAQIGTTMTEFDASNAFMSVHHTTLDKLVEASFEDEMEQKDGAREEERRA